MSCPRLHLCLWLLAVLFLTVGVIHCTSGLFFGCRLPLFNTRSNLITGAFECACSVALLMQALRRWPIFSFNFSGFFMLLSSVCNLGNMAVLEICEWRLMLDDRTKQIIWNTPEFRHLATVAYYLFTSLTIVSIFGSLLGLYIFSWRSIEQDTDPIHFTTPPQSESKRMSWVYSTSFPKFPGFTSSQKKGKHQDGGYLQAPTQPELLEGRSPVLITVESSK